MNTLETKKVSAPLAIGIFLIPLIFAWFTLRKGYTTTSRVISFVWLILGFVAFVLIPNPTNSNHNETDKIIANTSQIESNIKNQNNSENNKEISSQHHKNEDLTFKIKSDEKKRDIKRVVEVEIHRRINENQLKNIANKIKAEDENHYERTFILFFIPEITNSAWATASFDPDLVINMVGSTKEEHDILASKNVSNTGELIGKWNANWGYEYQIIIEEKDGKIFERNIYANGEQPAKELKIININDKRAYQDEVGKDNGEYYIINKDGNLEFWSKNGNYYTAKK